MLLKSGICAPEIRKGMRCRLWDRRSVGREGPLGREKEDGIDMNGWKPDQAAPGCFESVGFSAL